MHSIEAWIGPAGNFGADLPQEEGEVLNLI